MDFYFVSFLVAAARKRRVLASIALVELNTISSSPVSIQLNHIQIAYICSIEAITLAFVNKM